MSALRFLGLIFFLVAISGKGRAESAILDNGQDQISEANQNSFSIQIPLGGGNVIQTDNQVTPTVQRRLSLEDFFLNRNENRQEQTQTAQPQQVPLTQFQVQQPDPNSVLLVRDAQFPSSSGGLISRLLMARRILRLRRIARRLTVIPRLFGFGLRQTLQRSALTNPSPLSLFSNRIGEAYDPRDFVFGSKAFSYQNDTTSNTQQRDASADQQQQPTRGYPVETEPYYNSNYDSADQSNYDSEELNELKKQQEILNSLTDEQQALLLQQLLNYQQQLNQLQHQINNPNNNVNQAQVLDQQPVQYEQPQQNYQQPQPVQYPTPQVQQEQLQQKNENQQLPQGFNNQQLEQIRLLQEQLLQEQKLQQQQLQQLREAQNLQQHQNHVTIEQERNQQQVVNQNIQETQSNTVGDRTEGSSYASQIGIGGGGKAGNTVGVGINVGIGPPTVDVQVTKPVSPVIQPLPPIVNPIIPKPVPAAPVVEPLVPIGILPKPILNLKGRMFFGAEMGKGVGIKSGVGR